MPRRKGGWFCPWGGVPRRRAVGLADLMPYGSEINTAMVRLRRVETASVVGHLAFYALGAGPENAPSAECLLRFDFDGDGDVDFLDYGKFLAAFTGP